MASASRRGGTGSTPSCSTCATRATPRAAAPRSSATEPSPSTRRTAMTHEQDGERLVILARDAIVHELGGPAPVLPVGPWFEQPAATFVTVTRRGRLHGCIGSIAPR